MPTKLILGAIVRHAAPGCDGGAAGSPVASRASRDRLGRHRGQVPRGSARCAKAVPGDAANYPENHEYNDATRTLRVGGGEFAPVAAEVYNFEVSGLKVVQSWLGYRMKAPKGRKSSPLDDIHPEKWTGDFTTELLELLWVLEATIAEYPAQARLLRAIVKKGKLRV